MTASAIRAALCGALLALASAESAAAATVSYYYVSGPGHISNAPAENRPLLNTGHLTIDRSKAPGGSLANLEVQYRAATPWDEGVSVNADVFGGVDFSFGAHDLAHFDLSFDARGQLAQWSFGSQYEWSTWDYRPWSVASGSDRFELSSVPLDTGFSQRFARESLEALGYREGTKAYQDLYCGSWAGETCLLDGLPAPAWTTVFAAEDGGTWFSDPLAFARQVEENTKLALANPPVSYHDIQSVPLPAAGVLLVGAVGFLVASGLRGAVRG